MAASLDKYLIDQLQLAPDPETTGDWPGERLRCLIDGGIFRWGLPEEFGGIVISDAEMLNGYIELSRVCLTTSFILTQRNAACYRIAASENQALRDRLLPDHCEGRALATVGISHLSTSRQHWNRPSVSAVRSGEGYAVSGEAPWVTGAAQADLLVTGATLDGGDQILVAIPMDRTGVCASQPLRLLALNGSRTGSVMLHQVQVHPTELLLGPCPEVMKVGATGGTGSLTTTAVALGASARTLEHLRVEAASRPGLEGIVNSFCEELARIRSGLLSAAGQPRDDKAVAEQLRLSANSLVSRSAQAFAACAKGGGFVAGHPAERAIRESVFFQVWSCPPAVTQATLRELIDP